MFRKLWKRVRANRTVYFFLLPSVLIMLLIVGYPLLNTIYFSLTDMTDETFSMDSPKGQKRNKIAVQELEVVVPSLQKIVAAQKKIVASLQQGTTPRLTPMELATWRMAVKERAALIKKEKEKEVTTEDGLYGFGIYYDLNLEKLIEAKPPAGNERAALLAFEQNILSGDKGLIPRLQKERRTLLDKKKKHPTRFIGLKNIARTLGIQDTPEEAQLKKNSAALIVTLTTARGKAKAIKEGDAAGIKAYDRWLLSTLKGDPGQAEQLYRLFNKRTDYLTPAGAGAEERAKRCGTLLALIKARDTLNSAAYTFGNRAKDTQFSILVRIKRTIERMPQATTLSFQKKNNRLQTAFKKRFPDPESANRYAALINADLTAENLFSAEARRYSQTLSREKTRLASLSALQTKLQKVTKRSGFQERALAFTVQALSNRQAVMAILAAASPDKRLPPAELAAYIKKSKTQTREMATAALQKSPLLYQYISLRYSGKTIHKLTTVSKGTLSTLLAREEANYKTANEIRGDHSSGFGFWNIFLQTIIWTIINVVMHFSIGLYLAHWLNKRLKGNTVYRAFLMIPWTVPTFVAAFSWRLIFDFPNGILNRLIEGLGGTAQNFMGDQWILTACIIVNIWVGVPFMMITLLGGLQTIPGEQYEAAEIDGANAFQKLMQVTLPGLKPVASVAVLLGFIWTFNMFNIIYLVTLGIEMKEKNILVTYAYDAFQKQFNYAESATYGVIILSLLLAFGSVYIRMLKKGGEV